MADGYQLDMWAYETLRKNYRQGVKVIKTLFSGKSEFQQVDVLETEDYGRILLNDGLFMLSEKDEFVYHDMISHVPLFVHPNPKRVLIIGGGDGGTAREVLRHKNIERVVMVEIDKMVVDACREFISQTSNSLTDKRLELRIEDGVQYVRESKEFFDVILIDSTDPIGPAAPLFDQAFYQNAYNILSEDGIVVSQAETPWDPEDVQSYMLQNQRKVFPKLFLYIYANMMYPGGHWCLGFASKKYHPILDFDVNRVKISGLEFSYYNEEVHRGAFMLPTFIKKKFNMYLDKISW